jgi:hypothetical protein
VNGRTHVTIGDTTARLAHWCEAFDVPLRTAIRRIEAGWPAWEAVSQPQQGHPSGVVGHSWRDGVPYEHDLRCQRFVAEHPHGATLEEVGVELGVSRERIRQIEAVALRRLRKAAQRLAPELEEVIAQLLADRGEVTW